MVIWFPLFAFLVAILDKALPPPAKLGVI